jgi:hypothetical protein
MNETTHPAPDKKSKPIEVTEAKPKGSIGDAKTIPVKHLAFHVPHPKLDATQNISAESRLGQRWVAIEFVPSLRHHRLEIRKPGEDPRVLFIHEVHVASWEPLA